MRAKAVTVIITGALAMVVSGGPTVPPANPCAPSPPAKAVSGTVKAVSTITLVIERSGAQWTFALSEAVNTNLSDVGTLRGRLVGDQIEFVHSWKEFLFIPREQRWFARVAERGARLQMIEGRLEGDIWPWLTREFSAELVSGPAAY